MQARAAPAPTEQPRCDAWEWRDRTAEHCLSEETGDRDPKKIARAIQKKLRQIAELQVPRPPGVDPSHARQAKADRGEALEPEQSLKLQSKASLEEQLGALAIDDA